MPFTTFFNGRLCKNGEFVEDRMIISSETGLIVKRGQQNFIGGEAVDLEENIIAPGFIELQTNGMCGFHFSNFEDSAHYQAELHRVSKFLVTQGVTSFYATLPTVSQANYAKILPSLGPKTFSQGASLLGAHVEGPYLAPSRKGAHTSSLFQLPSDVPAAHLYGPSNLSNSIKFATVAPELPNAASLISSLSADYGIRVSLGHSDATYDQGEAALAHGATCLTHLFNAMQPLHHRTPGLAGLIARPKDAPYYSLIADGVHLHPATLSLAYRANPSRCILITDSVELAGLPDGTYPGNAQVSSRQTKLGPRVVLEGTDTLIGSCASLDQCVRNLIAWSGCSIPQAVRCVTENIAELMGLQDRGKLEEGRRADFVILDDEGTLLQTWVAGVKVWDRHE